MQSLSLSPAGEMENPCLWDQRAGLWSQHGVLPLLSCFTQVSIFCLCLWRPFLLFHSARCYNITTNTLDHWITLNSPFSLWLVSLVLLFDQICRINSKVSHVGVKMVPRSSYAEEDKQVVESWLQAIPSFNIPISQE